MNVRRLMCPPRHLLRGNVATLKSKLSYHVGIGPNTPNVTAPWPSRTIRLPNVAFGSKPEKLNVSTCFPLFTQQRTSPRYFGMSVSCHQRTHALQYTGSLFDHLVSGSEQRRWNSEAERLRSLEIDDQLEFGWLLDRQVARFRSLLARPRAASGQSRRSVHGPATSGPLR